MRMKHRALLKSGLVTLIAATCASWMGYASIGTAPERKILYPLITARLIFTALNTFHAFLVLVKAPAYIWYLIEVQEAFGSELRPIKAS